MFLRAHERKLYEREYKRENAWKPRVNFCVYELPCIASIYFTYTLKIYMRTQAKILLPWSCKNKTTCPKETTVNLSIFAAFHTTYLKSGRPFTFNDYDPEERNSKVALL